MGLASFMFGTSNTFLFLAGTMRSGWQMSAGSQPPLPAFPGAGKGGTSVMVRLPAKDVKFRRSEGLPTRKPGPGKAGVSQRTAVCRARMAREKNAAKNMCLWTTKKPPTVTSVVLLSSCSLVWSEWRESNSRPLEPHSSALPNCATPGYVGALQSAWPIIAAGLPLVKENLQKN